MDYTIVNGQVFSENRGGTKRDYVPDPLGNTVALLDDTQAIANAFSYWSYGELQSGDASATKYLYVGGPGGRRQASGAYSFRYRQEQPEHGRWMTVDLLWPSASAFTYAATSPATRTDPLGLESRRDDRPSWWPPPLPWPIWPPRWMPPDAPTDPPEQGIVPPKLDPSLNPFKFGYGNCCGWNRRCNECDARRGGRAIDCVDRACAIHDDCVGEWYEYIDPFRQRECAEDLCDRINGCIAGNQCRHSPRPVECRIAAEMIRRLYCLIGYA